MPDSGKRKNNLKMEKLKMLKNVIKTLSLIGLSILCSTQANADYNNAHYYFAQQNVYPNYTSYSASAYQTAQNDEQNDSATDDTQETENEEEYVEEETTEYVEEKKSSKKTYLKKIYLRGDYGYAASDDAEMNAMNCPAPGNIGCVSSTSTQKDPLVGDFGGSMVWDAGLGINSDSALRTDILFSSRNNLEFTGKEANSFSRPHGKVKNQAVFFNLYLDITSDRLREKSFLTPYLGAGIGVSKNETKTFSFTSLSGNSYIIPGRKTNDFGWMLTAGFSSHINSYIVVDVGYKYMNLGKVQTDQGLSNISVTPVLTDPHPGFEGDLKLHEITAGLRLQF